MVTKGTSGPTSSEKVEEPLTSAELPPTAKHHQDHKIPLSFSIMGPRFKIWKDNKFFKRFYLLIHRRLRERERQRHGQREKQAPLRKPDMGLDPGPYPEPKADAQSLSHPGIPR